MDEMRELKQSIGDINELIDRMAERQGVAKPHPESSRKACLVRDLAHQCPRA